jgi:hypothetical protein
MYVMPPKKTNQKRRRQLRKRAVFLYVTVYIKEMRDHPRLKEGYTLARCCAPSPSDAIAGYFSHDNYLKVHRRGCAALAKVPDARLVSLVWDDILENGHFVPESDYHTLDETDFAVLRHHLDFGIDYSLMVAKMLTIPKQDAFNRHRKLRGMGLLKRVEPRMVQYRRGIAEHKWIKHRNHTYYELTEKGRAYLEYHQTHGE